MIRYDSSDKHFICQHQSELQNTTKLITHHSQSEECVAGTKWIINNQTSKNSTILTIKTIRAVKQLHFLITLITQCAD